MPTFALSHSALWLAPIVLGAAAAAFFLYKNKANYARRQKYVLGVLRFLTVALLAFLLLVPILNGEEANRKKPILALIQDVSQSVKSTDSALVNSGIDPSALSDKYDIRRYRFSDKLYNVTDSAVSDKTNIEAALREVNERLYGQNIGATVLITDGIYNSGADPLQFKGQNGPLFTLGLGDTTQFKDWRISDVNYNATAFVNNRFPVNVSLQADMLAGSNYKLSIKTSAGEILEEVTGTATQDEFYIQHHFILAEEEAGPKRYSILLESSSQEDNTSNNLRSFTVDILNNRQKVQLIARAPHPDIAAIRRALEFNDQLEFSVHQNIENDNLADLYILHEPDLKTFKKVQTLNRPFWYVGFSTPSRLTEEERARSSEEVRPQLNDNFTLFTLTDGERKLFERVPPAHAELVNTFDAFDEVLAYKTIGNVETTQPLWYFQKEGERKNAYLLVNGFWKWRMYDYRLNNNHQSFDGLINKLCRYLLSEGKNQQLTIEHSQSFRAGSDVIFKGMLYNASGQAVNDAVLSMKISDAAEKEYTFTFSKTGNGYSLNAGNFKAGLYRYTASVSLGNKELSKSGYFTVDELNRELINTKANHTLLRQLSKNTGGVFFKSTQEEELTQTLLNNENAVTRTSMIKSSKKILDYPWFFIIIVILLTAEWTLRKLWGRI